MIVTFPTNLVQTAPVVPGPAPPMYRPSRLRPGLYPCLFLCAGLLMACQQQSATSRVSAPPPPPMRLVPDGQPGTAATAMIASANRHASDAGAAVLRAGGSAVDAAIAAHAVLGLVEPQSSGLGGGGFLLVHNAAAGVTEFIDGRETAPAGADPGMFLDDDGAPLPHRERVQSGHGVGVPGMVAAYALAHERHGRLPFAQLFDAAIGLAEDGFPVSPRLHDSLLRIAQYTDIEDRAGPAGYFFPGGKVVPVGQLLRNPAYAQTLRRIATDGPAAFYYGDIPAAIVAEARLPPRPGTLAAADFARYTAQVREPVCGAFRQWRVCSSPPPGSGVAVVEALGLIERLAPAALSHDATGRATFVDALLLAYADRDHYVADGDFVAVPIQDLVTPDYLRARAGQRPPQGASPAPGDPGKVLRDQPIIDRWGRDATDEVAGTTHLSVVDGAGNAVALTASIEFAFGSQRMVAGFLLNNELTDFSSEPQVGGKPVANAVAPGKRPRSSMSPTIVFDPAGAVHMVTGSPGGNSIIAYVVKSIIGVLDFGLTPQAAADLPNIVARSGLVRMESGRTPRTHIDELMALGYSVDASRGENSGIHTIVVTATGPVGGADSRREGTVVRVPLTVR